MVEQRTTFRSRLPPVAREAIARLGQLQSYESGQVVVARGASDAFVYLIEDGEVEVRPDTAPPWAVGTGDLIGEEGFFSGLASTTAVARTSTRARRIDRTELATALATTPDALHAVLDAIHAIRQARGQKHPADSAESYVAALAEQSLEHRAVRHPYLQAIEAGTLPDLRWALQDFARHYYGYSRMFPRYLTTVLAKLDDDAHRAALLENLTEESGRYEQEEIDELTALGIEQSWYDGVPHPRLFARFAESLGVSLGDQREADQVICWREMFLAVLGRGSAAEAVGALGLGTENIVSTIYVPFVKAIERLELDGASTVFFPLHTAVDDEHQEVLQRIAASYADTETGRADLRRGMLKALQCRSTFWDWLLARASDPERAHEVA